MHKRLPTRVDRYPGKMNHRFARVVARRFVSETKVVLDPFCGSGALLSACDAPGRQLIGIDLNPVAVLLSRAKIHGFDSTGLREVVDALLAKATSCGAARQIDWGNRDYWFTPMVLEKFGRLRQAAMELREEVPLREWEAMLLCMAMAVRGCSRADQRSPKPFISARARLERSRRHYCPYRAIRRMVDEMVKSYSDTDPRSVGHIIMGDVVDGNAMDGVSPDCVVTSPPYLNAQDYFRNSKLELYVLEGLLPYNVGDLKAQFVGTERGKVADGLKESDWRFVRWSIEDFGSLETSHGRLAAVVAKYFRDMRIVLGRVKKALAKGGKLVIITGDNVVGGVQVDTSSLIHTILESYGFLLVESFADEIRDRMLAPSRKGHQSLIKEELVSCYELR